MSGSRQPTEMNIEHLLSLLPRLYKDGFKPLKRWVSEKDEKGNNYFLWPSYEEYYRANNIKAGLLEAC